MPVAPTPIPHSPAPDRGLLTRVALTTATVVFFIALTAALVGAQLSSIAAYSGIERRASLLAVMTSARLAGAPVSQWAPLTERLSARVGGIVTVVSMHGVALQRLP